MPVTTTDENTKLYGLTAVPADETLQKPTNPNPGPVDISSLRPPTTPLASRVARYAESKLSPETYRHSLRVYSYGCAMARQCFPEFELTPGSKLDETWFLTAMLHDIGTCDEFLTTTRLSYEFFAGVLAMDLLQHPATTGGEGIAPRDQAESVTEAIIRHQDVQDQGKITLVTRLIQKATLLDNIGFGADWVHKDTIDNVAREYPRPGWSGCFSKTVEKEMAVKPYAMVSRIPDFAKLIERNGAPGGLMAQYSA